MTSSASSSLSKMATTTTRRRPASVAIVHSAQTDPCEDEEDDGPNHLCQEEGPRWPRFLVNRGGFPLDELTWNQMWSFATHLHPSESCQLLSIRSNSNLSPVPIPKAPKISMVPQLGIKTYLERVQMYLLRLGYNHIGTQFFEIDSKSSLRSLMIRAKEMVREALPIKCLEAVMLAVFLTNGLKELGRFTINFKSEAKETQHRRESSYGRSRYFYHVVLGISLGNQFGALGLSRRSSLAFKDLKCQSLCSLISNFETSYACIGHKLIKVRIGALITHDPCSIQGIPWQGLTIVINDAHGMSVHSMGIRRHEQIINGYAKQLKLAIKSRPKTARKLGFFMRSQSHRNTEFNL